MKLSPIIISIFALTQLAGAAKTELPGSRGAKHIILPIIGYQNLNDEKIGFNYFNEFYDPIFNQYNRVEIDSTARRSVTSPVLGVLYRYSPLRQIHAELSLSAIHDAENLRYDIRYLRNEETGYTSSSTVEVSRSNTVVAAVDLILTPPLSSPVRLTPGLRLGGGYAWRKITVSTRGMSETASAMDADAMWALHAGIDMTLWSEKNFLIEGSISYTRLIPIDGDSEPFGGIGWKVSVFPIWSVSR